MSVWLSRSSAPSKQSLARSKPRTELAASKTLAATGDFSKKSLPMPTTCAPWPGQRMNVEVGMMGRGGRCPRESPVRLAGEHARRIEYDLGRSRGYFRKTRPHATRLNLGTASHAYDGV